MYYNVTYVDIAIQSRDWTLEVFVQRLTYMSVIEQRISGFTLHTVTVIRGWKGVEIATKRFQSLRKLY